MYEDTVFYTHGSPCFWWFKSPDDFEPLFSCLWIPTPWRRGDPMLPCCESGVWVGIPKNPEKWPVSISYILWLVNFDTQFQTCWWSPNKERFYWTQRFQRLSAGPWWAGQEEDFEKGAAKHQGTSKSHKKTQHNRPLVYDLQFFPLIKVCLRMFFYPWDTRQADKTSVSENRVYHNTPK